MKISRIIQQPQNIFLTICLVFGFLLVFINPPFQTPDEAQHLFKMYGYTNGTLNFKVYKNITGNELPLSLIKISKIENIGGHLEKKTSAKEVLSLLKIKLEKDKTAFYTFTPTSYTPVSYFPSFLILWAMKLLNFPPLIMLYMLRLCSLFLYTALGYTAIKTMPAKKWLMLLLALTPMTVYEAASITTDAICMGIAFLFIAYACKLAMDDNIKKITKKELAIFGSLGTLLLICKYAYFPILLLFFIIPKQKFNSQTKRYLFFSGLTALNIIITAAFIFHTIQISKGVISGAPGYEKSFMIAFIFNKFSWFMDFVIKTIQTKWLDYLYSYIGLLGSNDTKLPLFVLNYCIILILSAALIKTNREEKSFDLKSKIIFLIIFMASFFIILTSSFILFQCYPIICGVQGRYFIPVMPFLFFILDNKKIVWNKLPAIIVCGWILIIPFVLHSLINRFYI